MGGLGGLGGGGSEEIAERSADAGVWKRKERERVDEKEWVSGLGFPGRLGWVEPKESAILFEAGGRGGRGRHGNWVGVVGSLLGSRRKCVPPKSRKRGRRKGLERGFGVDVAPAGWAFLLLCLVPAGPRPTA